MKRLLLSTAIFLSVQLQAQFNLNWVKGMGGSGADAATKVFTDGMGDVYTTGYFEGVVDFDPGPGITTLTSTGMEDVYIMKQDGNGGILWAKNFGSVNTDSTAGIGIDNAGNIYVSGFYSGQVDLDPGPSTFSFFAGSHEVFISKFDPNGLFMWGVSMGSGANDKALTMCVDGAGNVYTAGYFEAQMDFDPGAGNYDITPFGTGGSDVFVSKLNTNGVFAWAVNLGGIGTENPYNICVDQLSNVYVTGFFEDVADFDPGAGTFTMQAVNARDAFVCKLNGNGALVWAKQFGGTDMQTGRGISINGADLYVSGAFQNTVDLDPGAGTFTVSSNANFYSAYLVKLTTAGNFVWAKSISGSDDAFGDEIRFTTGGIFWSGLYKGTADLDPGTTTHMATAVSGFDSFLTFFDVTGNYTVGESFPYEWNGFWIDVNLNIIAAGKYTLTRDFDPAITTSNMTALGMTDACVLKLTLTLLSVSNNKNEALEYALYPNPNNGNFEIYVEQGSHLKIINALGQEVIKFENVSGSQNIRLSECEAGVYFLMINTNGKQSSKKFVIQN